MDPKQSPEELEYRSTNKEPFKAALGNLVPEGEDVVIRANWNSYAKRKGMIGIQIGEHNAVIDREQLYALMFLLASKAEQDKMVDPYLKQTVVEKYTKHLGIQATRDIRKGELIQFLLEFTYNPDTKKIIVGHGSVGGLIKNSLGINR